MDEEDEFSKLRRQLEVLRKDQEMRQLNKNKDFSLLEKNEHLQQCPPSDTIEQRLKVENEILLDRLRTLEDENGKLRKLVSEKDFELTQAQKTKEKTLASTRLPMDVAATKIVELSKKIRMLTADLESERMKSKQKTNTIHELEKEMQSALVIPRDNLEKKQYVKDSQEQDSTMMKSLQDKLATANLKVSEYRNEVQALQKELKTAHKVLCREVGENVNLQQLHRSPGSFKGRAQLILALQTRVRDLELQLNQSSHHTQLSLQSEDESEFISTLKKTTPQNRNHSYIRSIAKERRDTAKRISDEHEALLTDHMELKKKLEASKARNTLLSSELASQKTQIATLLNKGRHDDELVDALLKNQAQMQDALKHLCLPQSRPGYSFRSLPQAESSHATTASPNLVNKLQRVVAEKDADIQELKRQIQQLSIQWENTVSGPSPFCSAGLPPEEGDIRKQTAPSLSISKFGQRLVLPAVGSSMESKDTEMMQEGTKETGQENSGTLEVPKLDPE